MPLPSRIALFMLPCLLLLSAAAYAAGKVSALPPALSEDKLDLYCLKLSYPQIKGITASARGPLLELQDGQKIPYRGSQGKYGSALDVDLKESMAQPYPLDPYRPPTPPGFAPGRKRPYCFLEAVYGSDQKAAQSRLTARKFLSSSLSLNKMAALAFDHALPELKRLAANPGLAPYLKPEGAYFWRRIAGENVPSAHSWGIAIDLGLKKSPYWRWSRERPHPGQQSHPGGLVGAMEKHGFIWGGKWHEYDLMHFEYRPELICKAKMLELAGQGRRGKFSPVSLKINNKQP